MQSVCVAIVTYNSREYLEPCLESVFRQTHHPLEVVVVDNASTDGTRTLLQRFEYRIRVEYNDRNVGFAAAQNQAIRLSKSDWVLALNPDVLLEPDFIEQLVEAARIGCRIGTVCGRLRAIGRDLRPPAVEVIDTAGIYFTPSMRHFDRGSGEPDDGRFREIQFVFGASAAAALYRREMIGDLSTRGNFFDPDFFAYREDADVAWRAQLLGWRCLYVPDAAGYHVRSVRPGPRSAVPAVLNMHSVKNRFLLRIKNTTGGILWRFWLPAMLRDVLVLGGCLLWEWRSLPALWNIAKCLPRALRERRWIMRRRRVGDRSLARWFSTEPAAEPIVDAAPERVIPLVDTEAYDAVPR
jgi:GT2 family glycosyltransferase